MNESEKITHITTVHPRHDTRVFLKECVTLASSGFRSQLVVADGLGNAVINGVSITDLGRPTGRLTRMLFYPILAWRAVRHSGPSIVHIHDPELLILALILKATGYAVIYDAHEDLPRAVLSKTWINPALRGTVARTVERLEDYVARRVDAVVAATPHIASRFKTIARRSVPVSNFPLEGELLAPTNGVRDNRTFCYIGAITRHRGAVEMVHATAAAGARLLLAGPLLEQGLQAELEALPEWGSVEYFGVVNRDEMRDLLAQSSAGLLFFRPEPNHTNALPNKLFEYLAAEVPVLCSDFPFWQSIIGSGAEAVGLSCDPTDSDAIADLMRQIMADPAASRTMGERGRELVRSRFSWPTEAERLLALYDALVGKTPAYQ
ncbi:MAG: glycosyltransferase [Silicimonas sp.]|jgi:glycosyltransferase involved in cell wall biosynthesis|uniref:glycosyltransferase n=1 Tax=Roseitalea porphyridii TaxID=1852022 RepID=UPI0032EE75C4